MKSIQTKRLVLLSLFIAIEILLALTPLGFIVIGPIRSTTLHIPVILAGILLGYKEGAVVGLVFGFISIITNTMAPTPASFVFSPFYEFLGVGGNGYSIIIALVPRMLLGLSSAFIYQNLCKVHSIIRVLMASAISTLLHTTLVVLGIYLFFGEAYALVREVAFSELSYVLIAIITTNGIMEMIVGSIIVLGVYKALNKVVKRS